MNTKTTKRIVQSLALGLMSFIGVEQARATTYTIGDGGLEGGWNLTIDGDHENGALVGGISLTPTIGAAIISVCTDVEGTVYLGAQYNYTAKSFASSPSSGIDPIWGSDNAGKTYANYDSVTADAAIQNAAHIFALHSSVLTSGSISDRAALQLAVWAALYDTGSGGTWSSQLTTSAGRFNAGVGSSGDAAALNTAVSWLNSALGTTGTQSHTQYSGNILTPVPQVQNGQIAQEMLLTPTPVPEPTTVIAGILLFLPFGASTIRHFRKHNVA